MTTDQAVVRSYATLSVLSALFTIATALALTFAPSKARAETNSAIVMSEGTYIFKDFDKGSMHFRDVVAEMQNGNKIVITAEVTVPATAGKPRTGSVVFSASANYSADGRFMDYTDDSCVLSQLNRQAGEEACAAISDALRDAAAPDDAPAAPEAEGIIMRDGGICDPIRHMGC